MALCDNNPTYNAIHLTEHISKDRTEEETWHNAIVHFPPLSLSPSVDNELSCTFN